MDGGKHGAHTDMRGGQSSRYLNQAVQLGFAYDIDVHLPVRWDLYQTCFCAANERFHPRLRLCLVVDLCPVISHAQIVCL